jgi:uncharacterized membrane protein
MNPLEKIVLDNLGEWGFLLIPFIAGVIVSFLSEVFNKITPEKYHWSLFLLIISTLICVLLIFVFPSYYEKLDAFTLLMLLLNIAVSFLFYPIVGKKLVGKIFEKFEEKANQTLNKV